jgi:uncharacterized membrane protein
MSDMIDRYLESLRLALRDADPATVRDALADAEEHLRSAIESAAGQSSGASEEELAAMVVEEYGTPAEVAQAYRTIEQHTAPAFAGQGRPGSGSAARRFFGILGEPRAYAALLYCLFSLVTGIVYFTWAVTGLSLSAGFAVMIFGIPFFGLFLLSVRGLALVEGRIIEALSGVRMPRRPIFERRDAGAWRRFVALVGDRRTWLSIAYLVLQMPLGILYFTLTVTFFAVSASFILRPVLEYWFGLPFMQFGVTTYWTPTWFMPVIMVIGLLLLIITMHLAKMAVRLHARYAKFMLVR